jgi:hypothetical protein
MLDEASPRPGVVLRAGPFTPEEPTSAYKVVEIIGSSPDSWEAAAKNAIMEAAKSIRHLRVGESTDSMST